MCSWLRRLVKNKLIILSILCLSTFLLVVSAHLQDTLPLNLFCMGAYSSKKQLEGVRETNETNRAIAQETNAMNLQLAREENAFNERMWNLTNQYNDPAKQAQRLKGAGLSDAAAAQAAAGFEAQPIQSANLANQQIGNPMQAAPESAYLGLNIVGLMREVTSLMQQTKELEMLSTEQEFQRPALMSKQDALLLNNAQSRQTLSESYQTFPYRLNSVVSKAASDEYLPKQAAQNLASSKQDYEQSRDMFGFMLQKSQKEIEEHEHRIRNLGQEFDNLKKQGRFIDSSTAKNQEELENLKKQGKILEEDWFKEHLDNELRRFGYPESASQKIGVMLANDEVTFDELADYEDSLLTYLYTQGKRFSGSRESRVFWYNVQNEGLQRMSDKSFDKQMLEYLDRKASFYERSPNEHEQHFHNR